MAGNNGGKRGLRVVGKPLVKVDAKAKCIGELKYADDLFLPRMLHTKLLRSTLPHARIVNIDVSRAKAYPGVHAVRHPVTGRAVHAGGPASSVMDALRVRPDPSIHWTSTVSPGW